MPLSQTERLRIVMEKMEWNQTKLGEVLMITQQAAGKIERGETKLKSKHAIKISEASDFHIEWLVHGTGPMSTIPMLVNEPVEIHLSQADISNKAIRKRFIECFEFFKEYKNIETYVQACDALHLNHTHVTNVRKGRKDVTMTMLLNCSRYGNINANYILVCKGGILLDDKQDTTKEIGMLKTQVGELKKDKEMLQRLIDISEPKRQTA